MKYNSQISPDLVLREVQAAHILWPTSGVSRLSCLLPDTDMPFSVWSHRGTSPKLLPFSFSKYLELAGAFGNREPGTA